MNKRVKSGKIVTAILCLVFCAMFVFSSGCSDYRYSFFISLIGICCSFTFLNQTQIDKC